VSLDGFRGDVERRGDPAIRAPFRQEGEHLELARREFGEHTPLRRRGDEVDAKLISLRVAPTFELRLKLGLQARVLELLSRCSR
jgi:hypothetical protein